MGGGNTLEWSVRIDENLVLRIEPIVNGMRLSERLNKGPGCSPGGLTGLSLGLLDAARWPRTGRDGTLLLLSCNCGAFDARVHARLKQDDKNACWQGLQDSRFPEARGLELEFPVEVVAQSVIRARVAVRRAVVVYAMKLIVSYRTNELPFAWTMSHLSTLGLIGMLLSGMNLLPTLPCAILVITDILVWTNARRYFGYHSVWIADDGSRIVGDSADADPCPYHPPGISYIQRNWFKAYWQDDGSPIWEMVRALREKP